MRSIYLSCIILTVIACKKKGDVKDTRTNILDKKYHYYARPQMDFDSITKYYGRDTALLIAGTRLKLAYEGKLENDTYQHYLDEGLKYKAENEKAKREIDLAFSKSASIPGTDYKILKKYLASKGNFSSNSFFYVETFKYLDKNDLVELVNKIENQNNLRVKGAIEPENIFYFYYKEKYYASVSSTPGGESPRILSVDVYISESDELSSNTLLQSFESAFLEFKSVVEFDSKNIVESIYFFKGHAYTTPYYIIIFRNALGDKQIAKVHSVMHSIVTAKFDGGKFISFENDESQTSSRVYEINEFGDLLMYDENPLGYTMVFKKMK